MLLGLSDLAHDFGRASCSKMQCSSAVFDPAGNRDRAKSSHAQKRLFGNVEERYRDALVDHACEGDNDSPLGTGPNERTALAWCPCSVRLPSYESGQTSLRDPPLRYLLNPLAFSGWMSATHASWRPAPLELDNRDKSGKLCCERERFLWRKSCPNLD